MPRIPIVTAETSLAVPRIETLRDVGPFPSEAPFLLETAKAFEGVARFAEAFARTMGALRRRQEEFDLIGARDSFTAELAIAHETQRRQATIRSEGDIIARRDAFRKDALKIQQKIESGLSTQNVRRAFRAQAGGILSEAIVDVQVDALKEWDGVLKANLDRLSANAAARAASATGLDEFEAALFEPIALISKMVEEGNITAEEGVERALKLRVSAEENRLVTIASVDPVRALELVKKGSFPNISAEDALRTIATQANILATKEARKQARIEQEVKEIQDDLETEYTTMIANRRTAEALTSIEFAAKHRLLPPPTILRLRQLVNDPGPVMSDRSEAARILLDVESVNPTVTEKEIDDRFYAGFLSLREAISAKSTFRAMQKAARDETKDLLRRQHADAEQELRAMTGVARGIVASALSDDPPIRVFAELLRRLNDRSAYVRGTENPLDVVREFIPIVHEALKGANLKPREINALYPDLQSLERARDSGKISQEQFEERVQERTGVPTTPVPPTTPRRRSGTPSPAEKPSTEEPSIEKPKKKRRSRTFGAE